MHLRLILLVETQSATCLCPMAGPIGHTMLVHQHCIQVEVGHVWCQGWVGVEVVVICALFR